MRASSTCGQSPRTSSVFVDDLQCQVGVLVLLRRIAGGINASEQQALYRKYAPLLAGRPWRVRKDADQPATRVREVAPACEP